MNPTNTAPIARIISGIVMMRGDSWACSHSVLTRSVPQNGTKYARNA